MNGMRTYSPKPNDVAAQWWVVDAQGQTLGRLATRVAHVLRGKHRPQFAPHADLGDHVVVVNAVKVAVTGGKMKQKMYYRHSGYVGGLREMTLAEMMNRHPERVIELAVKGMLPRGRLGRQLLGKLRVYAGPDHPHTGQQPVPLAVGGVGVSAATAAVDSRVATPAVEA